jgi:hypothetical protein
MGEADGCERRGATLPGCRTRGGTCVLLGRRRESRDEQTGCIEIALRVGGTCVLLGRRRESRDEQTGCIEIALRVILAKVQGRCEDACCAGS